MSNKERVLKLINNIPENRLIYVINMLESLQAAFENEEVEPDEWDFQMIADANKENDGTTVTIDELAKELGIDL